MHPFYTTSLGTFKRRLDEYNPLLLQHFASLALLHEIWTYLLRDNIFTPSIPVLCRSVMVSFTFKRRLDEYHPVLLQHFASLALLHEIWTYLLRDNIFTPSIPVLCRSVMVSWHIVCSWKNTTRMCNKKHIFGTLIIVWRE